MSFLLNSNMYSHSDLAKQIVPKIKERDNRKICLWLNMVPTCWRRQKKRKLLDFALIFTIYLLCNILTVDFTIFLPRDNMTKINQLESSRPEVFYKKGVLKNFTKFPGKHLSQIPRPATLLKKRLWHRRFIGNFYGIYTRSYLIHWCGKLSVYQLLQGFT